MSNEIDNIVELKLKLKSAIDRRIKNEKIENAFRVTERSVVEEMCLIKTEEDFIMQQLEDLKKETLRMQNQITMIHMCSASERARTDCYLSNLNEYKKSFDLVFEREQQAAERYNKELREKEAKQEESERKKHDKILETNEEKVKEIIAMETECEAIERECCILTKRNKAIMIKIRRRLIEAEETRRNLQKNEPEISDKI